MYKKSKFKIIIKLLITATLVYLLIVSVNWRVVVQIISNAKWNFIALFAFFYLCGIFISAYKWKIIADDKGFVKSYFFYLKNYLLGTFINNFLPSFVGGDIYRSYILAGKERTLKKSSSTVLIDRITGLISVVVLLVVLFFVQFDVLARESTVVLLMISMSAFLLFLVLFFLFGKTKLASTLIARLPQKIQKYLKYIKALISTNNLPAIMLWAFVFDGVGIALANYSLFLAVGANIGFFQFISVTFLTNIIASAPISIGNIGVKEWAYVFLFGIFGVSAPVAVSVVIISRVLQMLVSLVAIPFYFQNKKSMIKK